MDKKFRDTLERISAESARLDYMLQTENALHPFTPVHRATYGMSAAEFRPIVNSCPEWMRIAKPLRA